MSRPRQFRRGSKIVTAGGIERRIRGREWFWWGLGKYGRPKHPLVIANMPFIYVCDVARRGQLAAALPTRFRVRGVPF